MNKVISIKINLPKSIYSIFCKDCNVCVSWQGFSNQNGYTEMPPWLFKAISNHKKNCLGTFIMEETNK